MCRFAFSLNGRKKIGKGQSPAERRKTAGKPPARKVSARGKAAGKVDIPAPAGKPAAFLFFLLTGKKSKHIV
jgi:hypothetical protein